MLGSACLQTLVLTSDVGRARQFYQDLLGLPFKRESIGALVFDVGGAELRISPVPGWKPSEHTTVGFAVRDLGAELDSLAARGVHPERFAHVEHDTRGVCHAPEGAQVAWIRDPDGNIISIVEYA